MKPRTKPLARGYVHQIAFFIACGACLMLLADSHGDRALTVNIIYSLSLTGLYAISALYHCHQWSRENYLVMKRIDHAAIFALIAGTATPICVLGLKDKLGFHLLYIMWMVASLGIIVTIFWVHAPKWVRASFYLALGWLALPLFPEMKALLGFENLQLLLIGGVLYSVGALIYAFKWPDPFPQFFGYHELFHIFVVVASGFHFMIIYKLST